MKTHTLPLRALAPWNPFDDTVWPGLAEPISYEEVEEAVGEERVRCECIPEEEYDDDVPRGTHIARIAWFVLHGIDDPIVVDPTALERYSRDAWIVLDGNHRLAAAFFRDDDTIPVHVLGGIEKAEDLFGVDLVPASE